MPVTRRALLSLALAGALWPMARPAWAQRFVNRTGLNPGSFIWEPAKSAEGPVLIVVSLGERITHVYRGGAAIGISTCAPGRRGRRPPTGVFTITGKMRQPVTRRSREAAARERLTWLGTAVHAHDLSGYPASDGCVRLPHEFSALLYDITPAGVTAIIADEHTLAGEVVESGTLFPASAAGELSPSEQAVSILVSGADAKAFLMRDGVVERESRVTVREPQKELGTHVYSLLGRGANGNAMRWLAFGIASEKNARHLAAWQAPNTLNRIAFEQPEWADAAASALHAGATLMITDAAAAPSTRRTPDNFVVLASDTPDPSPRPDSRRRPSGRRPQRPRDDRDDSDDRQEPAGLHPESPR
jgi:L,D-transpeptidase catalytic domain